MKKNIFKKFIVLFSLSFVLFGYNFVFAEDIHLDLVPCYNDSLNSKDLKATPYCAILQSGIPYSWDWTWENSMGVLLSSLNDVLGYSENNVYYYWNWSLNSNSEFSALNKYELKKDDIITLTFTNSADLVAPKNDTTINFIIDSIKTEEKPVEVKHRSSSGSIVNFANIIVIPEKTFSVPDALEFLYKNQKDDGSYSAPMYTDWVAIALSLGDNQIVKYNLINYFKSNPISSSILTDYERRAMALMSLGVNPYNGTEINYIKKITDSFDGTQFGDNSLVNDDIFALVVLQNVGYGVNDEVILKGIDYIIYKQDKNGSWGSIDMTSAGIQALKSFENITGVNDSISKAENYLISKQKNDGGFENSFSTSWVLQSFSGNDQILKAENYLTSKQEDDGGMENIKDDINSRIWVTAYTIPAILHKPWSEILNNFSKPIKKEIIKKPIENLEQNTIILEKQDINNKNTISPINNSFWSKLKNSFKQFLIHLKF